MNDCQRTVHNIIFTGQAFCILHTSLACQAKLNIIFSPKTMRTGNILFSFDLFQISITCIKLLAMSLNIIWRQCVSKLSVNR